MLCLCCKVNELGQNTKFWKSKIPVCESCHALATSTWNRVEIELSRQRTLLEEWMEVQLLSGKLLSTEDPDAQDPPRPDSSVHGTK